MTSSREDLIANLEKRLRELHAIRLRLMVQLRQLEVEAESVRTELAETETLVDQMSASIHRLLSSALSSINQLGVKTFNAASEVTEWNSRQQRTLSTSPEVRRQKIPPIHSRIEVLSERFVEKTISQAVTLLLREEGGALHVNEIYNRLVAGGFTFTGQNPTISIAGSLNRNRRFQRVEPGTFDLVIRGASKAS